MSLAFPLDYENITFECSLTVQDVRLKKINIDYIFKNVFCWLWRLRENSISFLNMESYFECSKIVTVKKNIRLT